MGESDHEEIAEQLDGQSDALEHHVRELQDEIDRAKADWDRKRSDPAVPGAPPPEERDHAGAAQSGEGGRRAGGGPAGEQEPDD